MALAKIKLDEVDTKSTPVLADSVLMSDSEDDGRGKLVTGTALRALVGVETRVDPSGTDDTDALQAAIDVGGVVQLGEGTYIITSVDISNDVIIQGVGNDTIIKRKDGILTTSASNALAGMFTVDTHDIGVTIRDLTIDENEANQVAYDPYGYGIKCLDIASTSTTDVLRVSVSNVKFINGTKACIVIGVPNGETNRIYLTVDNCVFLNGKVGLISGHSECVSPYGYGPDYISFGEFVNATVSNNKFIFTTELSDEEFSRTAIRITSGYSNADGSEVAIYGNYFYRCGRGVWKNDLDEEQIAGNELGVIDAYNFGTALRITDNQFEDSIGAAIKGKTNCDQVTIKGNIIKNSGMNPAITFASAELTEQQGRIVVDGNHISNVTGSAVSLTGITTGDHVQKYIGDCIITNNIIDTVASRNYEAVTYGDGITIKNAERISITNNIIRNASNYGISVYGAASVQKLEITDNQVNATNSAITTRSGSVVGASIISRNIVSCLGGYGFTLYASPGSENEIVCNDNIVESATIYALFFQNYKHIVATGNISRTVSGGSTMFRLVNCNGNAIVAGNIKEAGTANAVYSSPTGAAKFSIYDNSWNPSISYDTAAPTTGTWAVGDIVYNTAPAPSGYTGWICTTAGTPGTWKGFGVIEA